MPPLLSYLQTAVDADRRPGRYVVTGSQNLLLAQAVTQSLAGRAGYLELMPLGYSERGGVRPPVAGRAARHRRLPGAARHRATGGAFLPTACRLRRQLPRARRAHDRIADLMLFQRFMRMMAARCGQLLNLNAVANDLGVAQTTARDCSPRAYIVFRLLPYHTNFGKRLVKTPKLYFWDTGLAAWLLGVTDAAAMDPHPMRGALFENLCLSEYGKYLRHSGAPGALFFWRDNIGSEVDLLIERDGVRNRWSSRAAAVPAVAARAAHLAAACRRRAPGRAAARVRRAGQCAAAGRGRGALARCTARAGRQGRLTADTTACGLAGRRAAPDQPAML
ncbi:MAG: DUF4143 domain-containing protein [Rubrivivax sp.]